MRYKLHRTYFYAELNAFSAKLYGLTEEELRYILGPQDVSGPDFLSETFRVFKEKEMRKLGVNSFWMLRGVNILMGSIFMWHLSP